jgi:hypothetical protein
MTALSDGFVAHEGGKMPVPGDTLIVPLYAGPPDDAKGIRRAFGRADQFAWWHDGEDDDIIAYRKEPDQ